jgi:hypothetical protein
MPGSSDLMEGLHDLDAAIPAYEERWLYYAGDLPEKFASARLRSLIHETAKDYRFRLARIPVESIANRLGINSITSSAGDAVNRLIEEIRQANDMDLIEPALHERTLVFGDAYLFVWPVVADEMLNADAPADVEAVAAGVELAYQSPLSCRAIYEHEDGRRVRFVVRRWKEKVALGDRWRAEVWYWDRVEAFVTDPGSPGSTAEEWYPYAEDGFGVEIPADGDNWPEPHDFGEIPFKHSRTDLPYGRSELEDFIGPQNILTKAISTQSTGIESHGWPERYRIADDKTILDQAGDVVPWGDKEDAYSRTETPEQVSGRRAGPGTEHTYHGTKSVGEWTPPDIGKMESPIEQWVRLGAAASSTPLTEFDPRFGANMSGVAWDRAERPLRAKEADRKRFLLRFWREVYALALLFRGVRDAGDITVNWAPPAVISDPEWWNTATVRRDHGVPQETILLEANYTAEDVEAWRKKQDEALLLDEKIDRLARLGDAVQKLGAGATLLGIPPERVASLVEVILAEAGSPGKLVLEEKEPPPELEGGDDDEEAEENAQNRPNESGDGGVRGSGRLAPGANAGR